VWRHIGTTAVKDTGTRTASGHYPEAEFIRTYETAVFDPDNQDANKISVPEERLGKESKQYAAALDRSAKILRDIDRKNVRDPFEVFNLSFTAPSSYQTSGSGARFFAKGNLGLDGNNTALGERLVSIQHARADAGTTQSNALQTSGNARTFSDEAYYAARELGSTFKSDVGKEMPGFGGRMSVVLPTQNGLVRSAMEIDGSDLKVNTAENNVNVQKGLLLDIISSPFMNASAYDTSIANPTQYFFVDNADRDEKTGCGLICIDFIPTTTKVQRLEETDNIVYKIKQSKMYGFSDWRNIIGSNGTGAAYSS